MLQSGCPQTSSSACTSHGTSRARLPHLCARLPALRLVETLGFLMEETSTSVKLMQLCVSLGIGNGGSHQRSLGKEPRSGSMTSSSHKKKHIFFFSSSKSVVARLNGVPHISTPSDQTNTNSPVCCS